MRKQGTVVRFDADRGFGFIRSPQTGADVFFHVRDYRSLDFPAPGPGMPVAFDEIHMGGKGPRGVAVRPAAEDAAPPPGAPTRRERRAPPPRKRLAARHRAPHAPSSGAWFMLPLMLAYVAALAWGVWTQKLPLWLAAALVPLNVATFMAYWHDKYRAQQDQWRIAESTLHFWSFAGGWPGAWFAQRLLRHKTRKAAFQGTYWFSVVAHCAALGAWLWLTRNGVPGRLFDF
ncbi:MAG: colD-shock DNA-binding protein [Ramlibacter sp.]|nr:colD-shock DNA-binding protein [Ramlibacter sp.]